MANRQPDFASLGRLARCIALKDQQTPFLAVDLDAMERNIELMAAYFRGRPARLRPHVKHHKCTEIAQLQMDAGAVGVTCATTDEVEAMAKAGIEDVLLANVVTDPPRLASLAVSAKRVRVTAAADSQESAEFLSHAAQAKGAVIGVVVDFDIGMRRNGVGTVEEGVALAQRVSSLPGLIFRGVMAYEGHLVAIEDREARSKAVVEAFKPVEALVKELEAKGFEVSMVTGGSASTYESAGNLAVMTDVQAGSYPLMDASYLKLIPEFEPALAAIATVSTSRPNRPVVVDVGSKRIATDWGKPMLAGFDAEHVATSEEHNRFLVNGPRLPDVGERVAVIPAHSCPTIAMHSRMFGLRGERLERVLIIDARDPLA